MTRVVVAGAVANKHRHGGSIWVRMSWAEALRALGFDVLFVEQIAAGACVDGRGRPAPFRTSENARVFADTMRRFGFEHDAALVCEDDGDVAGITRDELLARAADAALLVNISGHLRWPALLERLPHRAFVDLDPGFTQIWAAGGEDGGALDGHELHFTVGEHVGEASCTLPTAGVRWRAIRQPVVLERWQPAPGADFGAFTTVASWRGAYGPPSWNGRRFGVKAHEFRRFAEVPERTGLRFDVALDIHPGDDADAARLRAGGWRVADPATVAGTDGFRAFVRGSGAEFSPAQGVYVDTRSGWFSDRTVRYLAAGRPALVQDTGFSEHLPVGAGLLAFSTPDEACRGAHAIVADYAAHRAAARRIAERHFAPRPALAPLLRAGGLAP